MCTYRCKVSVVKGWLISDLYRPSINTQSTSQSTYICMIEILSDTQWTLHWILSRLSVESELIFTDMSLSALIDTGTYNLANNLVSYWLTVNLVSIKCRCKVNQVSIQMSIECQSRCHLRVLIDNWQLMTLWLKICAYMGW